MFSQRIESFCCHSGPQRGQAASSRTLLHRVVSAIKHCYQKANVPCPLPFWAHSTRAQASSAALLRGSLCQRSAELLLGLLTLPSIHPYTVDTDSRTVSCGESCPAFPFWLMSSLPPPLVSSLLHLLMWDSIHRRMMMKTGVLLHVIHQMSSVQTHIPSFLPCWELSQVSCCSLWWLRRIEGKWHFSLIVHDSFNGKRLLHSLTGEEHLSMEARKFLFCGWSVHVQMLLKLDPERGKLAF